MFLNLPVCKIVTVERSPVMKASLTVVFKFLAAIVSVGFVLFSIPLLFFIVATSAGDPPEIDRAMASTGAILMIDGGIIGGWLFHGLRRRKWWRLIVVAPFAALTLLGGLFLIAGRLGGAS
jgi:hypothetical protein